MCNLEFDNSTSANEMHARLLEMMKQFHLFCESIGMPYYMLGGTSLGAFRHKGFIPWDDDMDIGIPRKYYDKLLEFNSELPEGLEIKDYHNDEEYPYNFAKLIDSNTTLIERDYNNHVGGVYIDIFPLDGASDNSLHEKLKQKKIFFWHNAVMCHYMTKPKRSIPKKGFMIISKTIPANILHKRVDILMKQCSWDEATVVANYLGSWHEKEVMDKAIFGVPKLYQFEDTSFYGPENMEKYLTCLYGNYMQLPPEEERIFRHSTSVLDLNKPYKKYLEHMNNG